MDGVLIISNPAHLRAWQEFGPRLGLTISEELFYREFSGRKNEEALESAFPGRFTEAERAKLSREKEALYRERFGSEIQPVPGVCDLVHTLHDKGIRLALASSAPPENADFILRHLGLEAAFDAVVTGQDVREAKPHPAIFLTAATRLDVSPQHALVIEDSIPGVEAAVAAGATCLGVSTSESPERLLQAGASNVVEHFFHVRPTELKELVKGPRPTS